MPIKPFQYYILGFRDFIKVGNFQLFDEADAASSFINLVESKLEKTPDYVMPIIDELMPTLEYIASNQELYKADVNIFGDFLKKLEKINQMVDKKRNFL